MSVLAHNNKIIITPNGKGLTAPGLKYETGRVYHTSGQATVINHSLNTDKLVLLFWLERTQNTNNIPLAGANCPFLYIGLDASRVFNGMTYNSISLSSIGGTITRNGDGMTNRVATTNLTVTNSSLTIPSTGLAGYALTNNAWHRYIIIAVDAGSEDVQ